MTHTAASLLALIRCSLLTNWSGETLPLSDLVMEKAAYHKTEFNLSLAEIYSFFNLSTSSATLEISLIAAMP